MSLFISFYNNDIVQSDKVVHVAFETASYLNHIL